MKRIAVDLAKSVYQVAESVRSGQVVQRKRLNREAFRRYIQEQTEPVEWVMEACGTAHYWGRVAQSLGHRVKLIPAFCKVVVASAVFLSCYFHCRLLPLWVECDGADRLPISRCT